MSQNQSHNSDYTEPHDHDSIVQHYPIEDTDRLLAREVEEIPSGENNQEDNHIERVVNEAEEENDKNDDGIVGEKMGNVLGYSGGSIGDRRREAERREVEELTPWTTRRHDGLARFFEVGE